MAFDMPHSSPSSENSAEPEKSFCLSVPIFQPITTHLSPGLTLFFTQATRRPRTIIGICSSKNEYAPGQSRTDQRNTSLILPSSSANERSGIHGAGTAVGRMPLGGEVLTLILIFFLSSFSCFSAPFVSWPLAHPLLIHAGTGARGSDFHSFLVALGGYIICCRFTRAQNAAFYALWNSITYS